MSLHKIDDTARDTIIAALRLWQEKGMHINGNVPARFYGIATNEDTHPLMSTEAIDVLIEDNLNSGGITTMEELEAALGG